MSNRSQNSTSILMGSLASGLMIVLLLLANKVQQSGASSSRAGQIIDGSDDELESQMPLVPSDDEEVGSLVGNEQLFSDYCVQSRDIILGDVKRSVNDLVNSLFSLFYRSFELLNIDRNKVSIAASRKDLDNFQAFKISLADDNKQQTASGRTKAKMDTKWTIAGSSINGGDVAGAGGGSKGIGANISNFPLFRAILGAISGIKNAIASTVMKKLDELRRMSGLDKLAMALGGACDKIFSYDNDLRARFSETKQHLVELDESISSVEFIHLNCVTIRRVMRLKGICGFASHFQNPIVKMLLGGDSLHHQGASKDSEWDQPLGVD